jgi:hypothetical protein
MKITIAQIERFIEREEARLSISRRPRCVFLDRRPDETEQAAKVRLRSELGLADENILWIAWIQ